MTIVINGRFLSQAVTGVQRYALELTKQFDKLIGERIISDEVFLVAPPDIKYKPDYQNIEIRVKGLFTGQKWEQTELPGYVKGRLLVNLANTYPLLVNNQFVTIHDAAVLGFPEGYSLVFRKWYEILIKLARYRTRGVLTVSDFSKTEILKYGSLSEDSVYRAYLGADHILGQDDDDSVVREHNLQERPYILAVSSISKRKNFAAVLAAIQMLEESYTLVIAGGMNSRIFNSDVDMNNAAVKYVGRVSDGQLKSLYKHAACFIYPSLYEGFGLPPLEAMLCRCPVIAARVSSIPEVCQQAVLYCDPYNTKDIAAKIDHLMKDIKLQDSYRRSGFDYARRFTWRNCAVNTYRYIAERAG